MLAGDFQLVFQLIGGVEVVFYGAFVAPCDKYHVPDTGGIGFFYRVLDERFVHHWQHFFRLGLGGG